MEKPILDTGNGMSIIRAGDRHVLKLCGQDATAEVEITRHLADMIGQAIVGHEEGEEYRLQIDAFMSSISISASNDALILCCWKDENGPWIRIRINREELKLLKEDRGVSRFSERVESALEEILKIFAYQFSDYGKDNLVPMIKHKLTELDGDAREMADSVVKAMGVPPKFSADAWFVYVCENECAAYIRIMEAINRAREAHDGG